MQNLNSLTLRYHELCEVARPLRPAILGLAETHYTATAKLPAIPDYLLAMHADSPPGRRGGTALYIRKGLSFEVVQPLCYCSNDSPTALVTASVRLPGLPQQVLVSICYRPPEWQAEDPHWNNVESHIRRCATSDSMYLLLGDFNARHPALGDCVQTTFGQSFVSLLNELGLTALNPLLAHGTPTRPTSGSILDLAITNRPEDVLSLIIPEVSAIMPSSDHSALVVLPSKRPSRHSRRRSDGSGICDVQTRCCSRLCAPHPLLISNREHMVLRRLNKLTRTLRRAFTT